MAFWVYVLAKDRNSIFYVGHTDDLPRCIWEHRAEVRPGFTSKYGVERLVHAEPFPTREEAMARERRLKRWNRTWKMGLIEETNPKWDDLYLSLNEWYAENAR